MSRGVKAAAFVGARYTRKSTAPAKASLQRDLKAGLGEIVGALQEFIDHVNNLTPGVLLDALEETFGKAIEYCPELTGELRDSAYLEEETKGKHHVAAIGFGKHGKPDYAVFVHEMPYRHEAPTRSKFLEAALDEDYFKIITSVPRLIKERAGT